MARSPLIAGLLLVGALVTGSAAQSDPPPAPPPDAATPPLAVAAFGREIEADASLPLQACVFDRTPTWYGPVVLVVVAVLTPEGLFAQPPVWQPATGPYAAAQPLDCLGLDPEPLG